MSIFPKRQPLFLNKKSKKTCDFIHTVSDSELKKGDVMGVHRGIYDHYGIYTGRGKVIHFSNEGRISAAISAFAEQLSHSLKTVHRMFSS